MILKYSLIILGSWLTIYYGFFMAMIISLIYTNDEKLEEACKRYGKSKEDFIHATVFCIKFVLAMILCGIALVVYSVLELCG